MLTAMVAVPTIAARKAITMAERPLRLHIGGKVQSVDASRNEQPQVQADLKPLRQRMKQSGEAAS
jgi:hypothetical protein